MSKYSHLILIISVSILFSSLVSAQDRIQETRLLVKTRHGAAGALGVEALRLHSIDWDEPIVPS